MRFTHQDIACLYKSVPNGLPYTFISVTSSNILKLCIVECIIWRFVPAYSTGLERSELKSQWILLTYIRTFLHAFVLLSPKLIRKHILPWFTQILFWSLDYRPWGYILQQTELLSSLCVNERCPASSICTWTGLPYHRRLWSARKCRLKYY